MEGFSHIILIYHFHLSKDYSLIVTPFLDDQPHGVFATRAPERPNSIGLSVVKLNAVKGDILDIENVDIIDGTPLLDIKPYVPNLTLRSKLEPAGLEKLKNGCIKQNQTKDLLSPTFFMKDLSDSIETLANKGKRLRGKHNG